MALTLYELLGNDDRRLSPYCWRTRMALAHKGLDAEFVACKFTEKDKIAFSGQERVPVLRDGDASVYDSWTIACHLEDSYPDRPSLFGGSIGRGEALFINCWADQVLHPTLFPLVIKDIYDHIHPDDRAYFRESREARFGKTLEDLQTQSDEKRQGFVRALTPLRSTLGTQPFLCGDAPAYGDYIVFGAFQWARSISAFKLLDDDDLVHQWRGRMMDLFDGVAQSTTGYAV